MLVVACATVRECTSVLGGVCGTDAVFPLQLTRAGRRLLVCVVGVGPVAAALSVGQILEGHPQARGILMLGVCGSYDTQVLPVGSIAVASAEIWPEYGARTGTGESTELLDLPMLPGLALEPPNQIDLDPVTAAADMGLVLPSTWFQGPSLTVAGVSADFERARQLGRHYRGATENMEGFALALAARLKGLPFLEVRTVSNQVGARDKKFWDFKAAFKALGTIFPVILPE